MADRHFEKELNSKGFNYIAGTDEAGRGPLAGPLVVAAVILPNNFINDEIDDSKKLSEKKRDELYDVIIANAISYSIQIIDVNVVDELNIYKASKKGMEDAIRALDVKPNAILTDAMKLSGFTCPVIDIIKGDAQSISIAAASILAKVTRDRLMLVYDKDYPEYDFKNNKGYGTKKHLEALEKYGPTPLHRRTYEPVKSMLTNQLSFDI